MKILRKYLSHPYTLKMGFSYAEGWVDLNMVIREGYCKCSNCGDVMSNSYDTCDQCGYPKLNSQPFPKFIERICGNCDERIDASQDICYMCGYCRKKSEKIVYFTEQNID